MMITKLSIDDETFVQKFMPLMDLYHKISDAAEDIDHLSKLAPIRVREMQFQDAIKSIHAMKLHGEYMLSLINTSKCLLEDIEKFMMERS